MSNPVTLSGFNNIDFGSVLTALMTAARQPEQALQQQQTNLQGHSANLSTLATNLAALDTAATALTAPNSLLGRTVTNPDPSAITVTAGGSTPLGSYDIIVGALAHAQVVQSTSTTPDANSTVVASGGTLTIGGVDVTLSGNTTLQGLADAINGTDGIGATASVVQSAPNTYSLVLTGNTTGSAGAFSITNGLTGGSGVTFGANAVDASDAQISVNNVVVTSSTNSFVNALPGSVIDVSEADPTKTISVTVGQSTSSGEQLITNFVSAYNDLVTFAAAQQTSANQNDGSSLGHDALLRTVNSALQQALGGVNAADSVFDSLAKVGVGFTRTGQLSFDTAAFRDAVSSGGLAHVQNLISGSGSTEGVFQVVHDTLSQFTSGDGAITVARTADTTRIDALAHQIADFEDRLKIQQAALQKEFSAADRAISALNNQASSLTSIQQQLATL